MNFQEVIRTFFKACHFLTPASDLQAEYCFHFYQQQIIYSYSTDKCCALKFNGRKYIKWVYIMELFCLCVFHGYCRGAHSRMGRITHGCTYFHHEVNISTRTSNLNLGTDISSNTHLILNRQFHTFGPSIQCLQSLVSSQYFESR